MATQESLKLARNYFGLIGAVEGQPNYWREERKRFEVAANRARIASGAEPPVLGTTNGPFPNVSCGAANEPTTQPSPEGASTIISRCEKCNEITEHIGEQCMECFEATKASAESEAAPKEGAK